MNAFFALPLSIAALASDPTPTIHANCASLEGSRGMKLEATAERATVTESSFLKSRSIEIPFAKVSKSGSAIYSGSKVEGFSREKGSDPENDDENVGERIAFDFVPLTLKFLKSILEQAAPGAEFPVTLTTDGETTEFACRLESLAK